MQDMADVELQFLKEKLAFGQAQLRGQKILELFSLSERDLQIEHYKALVKTLEDLLSHTLSNENSSTPPPGSLTTLSI